MNLNDIATYVNKSITICKKGENSFDNCNWTNNIKNEFSNIFKFSNTNTLYQMLNFYNEANNVLFELRFDTRFSFKISQLINKNANCYYVYIEVSKNDIIFLNIELIYDIILNKNKYIESLVFNNIQYNIKSLHRTFDLMEKTKYNSIFTLYTEYLQDIANKMNDAYKKSEIYR